MSIVSFIATLAVIYLIYHIHNNPQQDRFDD